MRPRRYANAVVPHIIAAADGRIIHSELVICNATVMLGDPDGRLYGEPRRLGACSASLHIMVDDNDAVLARAVAAGCEEVQPPTDMFYGARSASLRDPFGHVWVLLTWKEDLSPAEMERRGKAAIGGEGSGPADRR